MSLVREHFARASRSLAGGVSSSTRVNQALGHPLYVRSATGCRVWDLDGAEFLDLCCSHGAALLGHGHPQVTAAVQAALALGAPCSYESEQQAELAELLCGAVPCLERLRFTGSGTEATMHCLRLARAVTGKAKVLRFEGNFHGYHDQVMWAAAGAPGQFAPPLVPISTGVAPHLGEQLVQIPYNNVAALEQALDRFGDELAAAICEPIYYNAGCVIPSREFITALRELCTRRGVLLIFDEVLSSFRMGPGGAQQHLGVTPDLCTLGKAVGGGYPLSVFGGRQELMQRLLPTGDCQHSGTYNAHPVVVAAALAAVKEYLRPGFYDHIRALAERLYPGLQAIFDRRGVVARVQGLGARFGIYFGVATEVRDFAAAQQHHRQTMLRFIAAAHRHGVYFHDYGGAACHHGFCSTMTLDDASEALRCLDAAVADLAASR